MRYRWVLGLMMAMLVMTAGRVRADDFDTASTDADGSIALAERMATFAHQTLRQPKLPAQALDMSISLYRAAMKLNATEPRFARSLADIYLEKNDIEGSIGALKAYLNLEPFDQTAFVQQLDVYLRSDRMQSVDQRLAYLRGVLHMADTVPPPVRSQAAVRCARLYLQRGQTDEAIKMLDSARILNPLNLDALRMRYVMTQADALPSDRVLQLLAMLQANPADPVVVSRLAEQLAQLGLVEPSVTWYVLANRLYQLTGVRIDPAFALGASSELVIGGHPEEAAALSTGYVNTVPDDADGWFIWLSIGKFLAGQDMQDKELAGRNVVAARRASVAITNRLQKIRLLSGETTATTRPVDSADDSPLPDMSGDEARLKAPASAELIGVYIESVSSLAWVDLYYRQDTVAADALLKTLAQFLPERNPTLQRLRAWRQYVGGDPAGALPKLKALAPEDPLAAMGVILIEMAKPANIDQCTNEARRLISEHPSGVIGAVLFAELSRLHVQILPSPAAAPVATLVNVVPDSFMQLITDPQGFYRVQATPVKPSFGFGQPILVRVTLQNVSAVDLAIGDESAVHPMLWFDAYLRGMFNQGITGAAIGRLDQRLVLAPGDTVSTVVRVDQDVLYPFLNDSPNFDLTMNMSLVMNPTQMKRNAPNQAPQAHAGVCGYETHLSQMIARDPTPITSGDQRSRLLDQLIKGDGGEKIRTMQVMAVYVKLLAPNKDYKSISDDFFLRLRKLPMSGNMQSWQKYLIATLITGADQISAVDEMSKDSQWQTRLLSLVLASTLGNDGIHVANQLSSDPDAIVRQYAVAWSRSFAVAATQPSDAAPPPSGSAGNSKDQ